MVESLEGNHESRPFVDVKAAAGSPKFSPDGRWLAYCSNETKKAQVYVQAFPGPGAKIQVSSDGGTDPVWKRNGEELYFRNGDKMMAVAVSTRSNLSSGAPASPLGGTLLARHEHFLRAAGTNVVQLRRHRRWEAVPDDQR
jgi:hypothetical protein